MQKTTEQLTGVHNQSAANCWEVYWSGENINVLLMKTWPMPIFGCLGLSVIMAQLFLSR